jgi:hypothetical protein
MSANLTNVHNIANIITQEVELMTSLVQLLQNEEQP